MNKCKNCGAPLDGNTKFCTQCGVKVEMNQPAQVKHPVPPTDIRQNDHPIPPTGRRQINPSVPPVGTTQNKANPAVIAIVVAIAVVIAGAAAFALVMKPKMEQASDYKQAISYASAGDYKQAADIFAYLGDYKDSEQKYLESKMEEAKKLIKGEDDFDTNFSEAGEILTSVEEKQSKLTEDGKRKLENLQEQCSNYKKAVQHMDNGNYDDAKYQQCRTCRSRK